MAKQMKMMEVILHLYEKAKEAVASGKTVSSVLATGLFDKAVKMKYDVPNDHIEMLDDYIIEIDREISRVR